MSILTRYLLKQLWFSFLAVLLVLSLIMFGSTVIRILTQAGSEGLNLSVLGPAIFLLTLDSYNFILPFAVLIASVMAFGHLFQTREAVIVSAVGLGRPYLVRVQLLFLLPIFIFGVLNALFFAPYGLSQWDTAKQLSKSAELKKINKQELLANQGHLLYVESRQGDLLKGIVLRVADKQGVSLVFAQTGEDRIESGHRVLVLREGVRYNEFDDKGQPDWSEVTQFKAYEIHLNARIEPVSAKRQSSSELSVKSLWLSQSLRDQMELVWRMMIPVSILLMGVLAVLLVPANPRAGKFGFVPMAVVFFVVYFYLMINLKSTLVASGAPPWYLTGPVVGMTAVLAVLYYWRTRRV